MAKEEKKKIKEKLFDLGERIREDDCLKCLTEIEKKIICYRYADKMEWENIAKKVNYSKMQCYRINDRAIEKLKEVLE